MGKPKCLLCSHKGSVCIGSHLSLIHYSTSQAKLLRNLQLRCPSQSALVHCNSLSVTETGTASQFLGRCIQLHRSFCWTQPGEMTWAHTALVAPGQASEVHNSPVTGWPGAHLCWQITALFSFSISKCRYSL